MRSIDAMFEELGIPMTTTGGTARVELENGYLTVTPEGAQYAVAYSGHELSLCDYNTAAELVRVAWQRHGH